MSINSQNSHYFDQASIDPVYYTTLRGKIWTQSHSLLSARGLFSATGFDVGTRILLKYLSISHQGNISLLDLGCGYGLISDYIASCYTQKHFPDLVSLHIDACDSSSLAIDVTQANLATHIAKWLTYTTICTSILSDSYFSDKKYDMIVTNPPFSAGKAVVREFIQSSYNHLSDGWVFWIVVPTNKWAKSYITITESIFHKKNISIVAIEAGYRVRTATK
jgi:16S rRNA (guanine1207-N2)-methyltransferase